jgi:16S rRNA (uracil1498-N3)-methyltransferase
MTLPLFYVDTINESDSTFVLNEDASKHIIQVLRMKKGEQLQLTDGKGMLLTAEIIDEHKKNCKVNKINLEKISSPENKITIAISLIKNASRFEWFLEKATEIGITEIIPLKCNRTEKQHFRYDRMKGILVSAMLQSHQAWLPVLNEPISFDKVVSDNNNQSKFIAHCLDNGLKKELKSCEKSTSSIILIGPEGDFVLTEIELALKNNYIPVSLGNNRLRTETAGIVAVTILNN